MVPLSSDDPSSETLMIGIVAGKVAVIVDSYSFVATGDEDDLFALTHF